MAVGDLSPWPASTAAASLTAAQAALRDALGTAPSDDRINRLGATAAAMVEQYAPAAPQPLKNEAVVRFAGYLEEANYGALRSETTGDLESAHNNHAAMFRNSGAAALLSRWRVRRAGAIG